MSDTKDFSYMGYQQMVTDITMALEDTSDVMTRLGLDDQAKRARETSERTKSHVFSVGILGEFKRGKSTVINALLGEKIAPADVVPASATLNRITYGVTPRATIHYKDGRREDVPVTEIANYVTKITEKSAAQAEMVDQAVVQYPCEFCKNNVEIIDTPGLNDDERMDAITEAVIPTLDAVVLVLSATAPFSKTEAEFVRNKLMTSDVSRLIVLVNFIDLIYDEDDRKRLLESIHDKFIREILDRTAAVHGEDSKIYRETKHKLSGLTLYPISAAKALAGRMKNNPAMVEESGILVFEERLRKMLTEERGALEIVRVSTIIFDMIVQGKNALELRMNTLEMSADEFMENKRQTEEQINRLRQEKTEEKNRIRQVGAVVEGRMAGLVAEKYEDLENRLNLFVDNYPINLNEIKKKEDQAKFQEQIRQDLEQEVIRALSEYAEQINEFLKEQMGEEAVRVEEYVGSFADQMNDISVNIQRQGLGEHVAILGVDGLSNLVAGTCTTIISAGGLPLMGVGGLIEGYRTAGLKGAATGLVSGAACSTAVAAGLIFGLGSVPFLPFAVLTGIAGTLGGKFITSTMWRGDISKRKLNEVREQLKQSIHPLIVSLKEQKLLENWAQGQVQSQVDTLVNAIETETEQILNDTQTTLNAIAMDVTKASSEREQMMDEYRALSDKLQGVSERLTPILQQATVAGA